MLLVNLLALGCYHLPTHSRSAGNLTRILGSRESLVPVPVPVPDHHLQILTRNFLKILARPNCPTGPRRIPRFPADRQTPLIENRNFLKILARSNFLTGHHLPSSPEKVPVPDHHLKIATRNFLKVLARPNCPTGPRRRPRSPADRQTPLIEPLLESWTP